MGNPQAGIRMMTPVERILSRIKIAAIRFRRRFIPYIIWHNQEIDVVVTFKDNKLRAATIGDACEDFFQGSFHEAKKHLNECGISFDSGIGLEGRDWEWDWSLSGPISVRMRGPARRPDLRK